MVTNMRLNDYSQKNKNKGAAMIVVIMAMSVVMILCLTLIVGAYQMFATVNDEGRDEFYNQQAISMSEVIKSKVTADTGVDITSPDGSLEDYISVFAADQDNTHVTKTLKTPADGDYYGMNITLERQRISGSGCDMVVRVEVVETSGEVMAVCTTKYQVKVSENAGNKICTYDFYAYY